MTIYVLAILLTTSYASNLNTSLRFQEQAACEEAKQALVEALETDRSWRRSEQIKAFCLPARALLRN